MAKRITIPVTGMHCAACQGRVQSALERTPGVKQATVNLMLHNASVTFDESAVQPETLVEAIRSTGYDAELPRAGGPTLRDEAEQDREREREVRSLTRKTALSLGVAVLTMILPMLLDGGMADGAGHSGVGASAWVLFALTTIVVAWPGRRVLHAGVARIPSPHGGHEHADRGRHRRGLPVLGGRDGGAAGLRVAWAGAAALL